VSCQLRRLDLTDAATRPASTYSGGMTRRLDLAMSLIGEPSILFLDEPTTGLDPRSRHTMWRAVRELTASGVTVFLTTQYLDEADALADRIGLLDRGRLVAEGTPARLKRLVSGGHITVRVADLSSLDAAARALGDLPHVPSPDELTVRIPSDGSVAALRALLQRFDDQSIAVQSLAIHTPDLDDVFFALTAEGTKP
jgi:ABC-2 type transport system ATP-binding protein